eukprot:jgi/Tetstr1/439296/TSEL_027737.t1
MDDDDFWADEETEEQVGLGDGLADRAVWGNNESTKDSVQEDEDEDDDGGNEDEEEEEEEDEGDEENNGGYWDVTFHAPQATEMDSDASPSAVEQPATSVDPTPHPEPAPPAAA